MSRLCAHGVQPLDGIPRARLCPSFNPSSFGLVGPSVRVKAYALLVLLMASLSGV